MGTQDKDLKEAIYGNISVLGRQRTITGHSHVPDIVEGTYAIGSSAPLKLSGTETGRMSYKDAIQGTAWGWPVGVVPIIGGRRKSAVIPSIDFAKMELRILADMAKEYGMCGDCIKTKLQEEHDPMTDPRRVCQLCRTVWPGHEPENRRREAILAQVS
jgi:hypothetical protein